jgi:hypothetical protein
MVVFSWTCLDSLTSHADTDALANPLNLMNAVCRGQFRIYRIMADLVSRSLSVRSMQGRKTGSSVPDCYEDADHAKDEPNGCCETSR